MRSGKGGRNIAVVHPLKRIGIWIPVALALLLPGCSSVPPAQKEAPDKHDAAALTVVAEIALKRGDCKEASETYAKAADIGTAVSLARRASEVSLACEQLPAAWQAANRWRALVPDDKVATATYAAVAIKLYRLPEAQRAVGDFARAEGGLPELAALLLDHGDAVTVLKVMSGALEPAGPSADTLSLLGELSLDAYDAQRAEDYSDEALKQDPRSIPSRRVLARAYVMRGNAAKAIATARETMNMDPLRGAFELADVLTTLDRVEEAHRELERLRSTNAPTGDIDRRLALLAYDSGDFDEAEKRFAGLAGGNDSNDAALLYLADIAARDGDTDAALAGYRKLADSTVALSARSRAASLLLTKKDRAGALSLLDEYATAHPESEFDLTLAKARLLADHGDAEGGLTFLSAELQTHPGHPSIEYDRAVILEQAGKVQESVGLLESLLVQRPDDPVLTNALGYTLADHNLELPRAETLIRRALASSPDSPAILDSLAWARYRQGDAKAAVPLLARAYSIQHDAEIAAHWGEVLWASGSQQEARRVWIAALARDPDSEPLKATLTRFVPGANTTHIPPPVHMRR